MQKFQEIKKSGHIFWVKKMDIQLSAVALGDLLQNVLRKSKKVWLCGNLHITACQEADKASVVLQLSESSFRLNGTVHAQEFSFL